MPALPDMASAITDIERQMETLARLKEAYALVNAHQAALADKVPTPVDSSPTPDLFPQPNPSDNIAPANNPSKDDRWANASKSDAVREAIEAAGQNYTVAEIEDWLGRNGFTISRQDASFVLSRLARTGEIKVKAPGSGARQTIYTKSPQRRSPNSAPVAPGAPQGGSRSGLKLPGITRAVVEWFAENPKGDIWQIALGAGLPVAEVEEALRDSPDLFRCEGKTWQQID